MDTITVTNTFEENKLSISFDLHDGTIPFAPFELITTGDIEFNPLVIKLAELLELNRQIQFSFDGLDDLTDSTSKLNLIKITLDEIYQGFNRNLVIEQSEDSSDQIIDEHEELF